MLHRVSNSHTLPLLLLVIPVTFFAKIMAKFPIAFWVERIKKEILWFKNKEMSICSAGETSGPGWVHGGVVEFACRECAGCEWPCRSPDKDTPLQLICTLWRCLKRDIWETADRCDKGGYDSSLCLAFLSSFASIPPACCLSVSSLCVSYSPPPPPPLPPYIFSFLPPPALPSLLVMAVPDTSVQSAKCHITETEISTWQSIWQRNDREEGRCACLVVLKGAVSITKYRTLR